jgi:hypothetical protein
VLAAQADHDPSRPGERGSVYRPPDRTRRPADIARCGRVLRRGEHGGRRPDGPVEVPVGRSARHPCRSLRPRASLTVLSPPEARRSEPVSSRRPFHSRRARRLAFVTGCACGPSQLCGILQHANAGSSGPNRVAAVPRRAGSACQLPRDPSGGPRSEPA